MIDTIVLKLDNHQFMVKNAALFSPSAQGLYWPPFYALGSGGYIKCVQNPTKADFLKGVYKPRLTLTKRVSNGSSGITLKIEFSAPKLIFGNNFDELSDNDFPKVFETLRERLREMGVLVIEGELEKAAVSSMHYSKNIILTDYTTCSMVMKDLEKADLGKRLDLNKTDYRNGGHAIRYHANSYEIVFYDKIKDMEQAKISEKRAFEKDNSIQFDLFRDLKPKTLEVLRMEIRFGNRKKLKSILEEVGVPDELTFQNLFRSSISHKILLHYWDELSKSIRLFSLSEQKPEDIFRNLQINGKKKPAKILQLLGGLSLIESVGIHGLRALIGKSSYRTWQRLKKDLESCPFPDGQRARTMAKLRHSLIEFLPIKLEGYASSEIGAKDVVTYV